VRSNESRFSYLLCVREWFVRNLDVEVTALEILISPREEAVRRALRETLLRQTRRLTLDPLILHKQNAFLLNVSNVCPEPVLAN
jgi:hypothetical protein